MMRQTTPLLVMGVGIRHSGQYVHGRGPGGGYNPEKWGITNDMKRLPHIKGSLMWRKLIKNYPRMQDWERPKTESHLLKYHRPDINWDRSRYQFCTVSDEEWPTITLKSEEMHMRDVDSWRDAYRLQLEGEFASLRARTHVMIPNNYDPAQRFNKAYEHALWLREKYSGGVSKTHPPADKLLDFEL
eukprot:TRINITY_DN13531_c0_g1_i1.p1 TRINITY_DN13531_c0_g1~~TRINITY_DN13531_c0_g1_i1.p1  ORF type:complete len:186 (+),score=26.87 TRINITY_DN13531_c0_g1_i1:59-616(+)